MITSNKQINDSDEYLDFIWKPNHERKPWSQCGGTFTETETAKVINAQLNWSVVVQNKSSPSKYITNRNFEKTVLIFKKIYKYFLENVKTIQKWNVYKTSFPDTKTRHIKDYVKPSVRETSNYFVFHVGINWTRIDH